MLFRSVIIFDFVLRTLRAYFMDIAGASIDQDVGEGVFAKLLAFRLDAMTGSTGGLASLMRELETLRDFFASVTLTAIVDVPFILLTLIVIAVIGGAVVFVPLLMIPLVETRARVFTDAGHRSISPKTMSIVPISATASAIMWPRASSSSEARCGKPGGRIFSRYGLFAPSLTM